MEKRLAAIEKELNNPTLIRTETPEVMATAEATGTATNTPEPAVPPSPTNTSRPIRTPRPTKTATPAPKPTPVVTVLEFDELVEEHRASRIIPEVKFEDRFYIKGQVAKITEREDGYQFEFEGSGLDLVCRLPASALATLQGRSIGDIYVVYGLVELDRNIFADDDLLIEECSIAAVIDGAMVWPMSTPTRTPTPTSTHTHTPTVTPTPTITPTPMPSFTVARDRVDARSGPGTNYPVVITIRRGQTFIPNGRNEAGDWLRFNSSRGHAWVYVPLMTVTGLDRVPVVSTPRPPTPPPGQSSPPTADPRQRRSCPSNCTQAHEMGLSNMGRDHLCYQARFDRDRDGIACER